MVFNIRNIIILLFSIFFYYLTKCTGDKNHPTLQKLISKKLLIIDNNNTVYYLFRSQYTDVFATINVSMNMQTQAEIIDFNQ